jgi:hypothetical protein
MSEPRGRHIATLALALVALTFVAGSVAAGPPLAPLSHDELESMLYESLVAAESFSEADVREAGISNDLTTASIMLSRPAPAFEASIRDRFGKRVVFSYGAGGMPIICDFPVSENTPEFCFD